jgi:predicted TPR repeat methyltransferase
MPVELTRDSSEDRPWLSWICNSQGTDELQKKYDTWANTYDEDVSPDWAFMPDNIAVTFSRLLPDRNVPILDAGSGTGLVGVALAQKGYTNLTAIDLSEKMLAIARAKQVYQQLYQGNLEDPGILQNSEPFAAIVAAGVFAYAHAGTGILNNLFRFLKVGGLFLLTIREDYRKEMQTDLEKLPWKLVSEENFPIYNGEKLMYLLTFQKERSL